MSISKKDVLHIAELARIKLDAEEVEKYEKELSAILEFIQKLNEVDTTHVEPAIGGSNFYNVTRKDSSPEKNMEGKQGALRRAAPSEKNGWIEVKAIFE